MNCPECRSSNVVKNGTKITHNIRHQRLLCRSCGFIWMNYAKNAKTRRIILIGDPHCGHLTGLTPSDYQIDCKAFAEFRRESWVWFCNVIELMKPFDYAIYNGDMIDGKQSKSGGLELLYPDRFDQVKMAVEIAQRINANKSVVIRGTKYHVGSEENFEDDFAYRINAPVFDRFLGDIGGKIFDIRHKIGRSSIPHGRMTPLSRQVLWSRLKAEKDGIKADVIIRSHVHYHVFLEENGVMAMTLPALQGASAYGAQECDGEVDYGIIILDIEPDGNILKRKFLPKLASLQPQMMEI